ncbi:MAG: hypothetical protein KIT10_14585 [Flavobacteriales bacterium]|nr:hypothetical protein [Flavobacteriales bacterium]
MAEIINNFGKVAGWNSQQAVLFGRKLVGISKIMYKDTSEVESVYGAGKYPIGIGDGNYSAECAFTISDEEMRGILSSLPPGQRIQDIPPFDWPVLTIRNGRVTKDVIRNVQFKGIGKEVSQNDKSINYETDTHCSHIDWNVQ